jgi:hypothetical protein
MGKKIQPNYSMTEEEVNEMVLFLESLPHKKGWYCYICGVFLGDNLPCDQGIFNRRTGESIAVCDTCLWDLDRSRYVIISNYPLEDPPTTFEEVLMIEKIQEQRLKKINRLRDILRKEGFDLYDFMIVPNL